MRYRYLVLLNGNVPTSNDVLAATSPAFRKLGLRSFLAGDSISVFVSEETPTIALSDGGVVIGHLFTCDGRPLEDGSQLPDLRHASQLTRHILDHHWGEYLLVQPIDGARALAITRDPSGGVGCVYGRRNGRSFITSDISIVTELDLYQKQVDWDFIAYFLTYPNHKTRRTALREVHELLPGCTLHLCGEQATTHPTWSPWNFVAGSERTRDSDQAACLVREAVECAVATWARMHGSILLELSGGLDSSIVAACLRGIHERVVCGTMTAPVPGADEREYAGLVVDHLGFPLRSEELAFDAARIEFAPPPHSVVPCMTALQYATNSLMEAMGDAFDTDSYFSGGGGDTVFCYLGSAAPAADAFKERGLACCIEAVRDLTDFHQCTFWKAARLTLKKLWKAPKTPCEADRSFLNLAKAAGAPDQHPWFIAPANALHGDRERIASLAGTQIFRDGVPRGARRWLRMPLLSQPVMEACLRVPSWMWIAGGRNRAVARHAFAERLPPEILDRRSKGTFVSYSGVVFRRNKSRIRDFLLSGRLREHDLMDTDALETALGDRSRSEEDSLQRMLDLCMVENWVRHQP